jgi:hypothetical protein
MAVIVRERRVIGGQEFSDVKVFLSNKDAITKAERQRAEQLDSFLDETMRRTIKEAQRRGLLSLKGKPGVLPLWYFVGGQLAAFIDRPDIVPPEDKKFVWRALWDHAGELAPGDSDRKSRKVGLARDHWRYCYLVYKKSKGSIDHAERAGTWRTWVEFIDRVETRNDERILDWFERVVERAPPKGWLRILTKAVHEDLNRVHTSVLTTEELEDRLERIWAHSFDHAKKR